MQKRFFACKLLAVFRARDARLRQGFVDLHTEWPLVREMKMAASSVSHEQRGEHDDVNTLHRGDTEPITYEAAIDR